MGWQYRFAVTRETAELLTADNPFVVPAGFDGAHAIAEVVTEHNVECLVVDHYGLDARFEAAARGSAATVLVIDDLADRPHKCDLLVDVNPERLAADYVHLTGAGTRFLLGPRYALLRPEFARRRPAGQPRMRARADRLLITLGGVDRDNVSQKVLGALTYIEGPPLKTVLVVGPANPHRQRLTAIVPASVEIVVDPPDIAGLMLAADLAIAPPSTTFWELACLGVPALLLVTADNQRAVARAAENDGAAVVLGESHQFDTRKLAAAITTLADDTARQQGLSEAGRNLVDGHGATRVADAVAMAIGAKQQEMCS
jgi:UDP-2,4-diacetamido-2,4,6-trideoxy-beta-L-altropyranose hydrolase